MTMNEPPSPGPDPQQVPGKTVSHLTPFHFWRIEGTLARDPTARKELREAGRLRRAVEEQVIERFMECGDPHCARSP
jgi:hypothetical protein